MKEGFKSRAPKKEIPPDIHEAFKGTSFSDEDVLSLAKILAEGKAINVASFTGVKHKLYEKGVKAEIQIAADRIKTIYASKEGVKVNNSLFEDHLVKQYVLGKFSSKPSLTPENAIEPSPISPPAAIEESPTEVTVHEKPRRRGTLSAGDDALEKSIETQKDRLAKNKLTEETRQDIKDRLDALQSFSTDDSRTRHKIRELEGKLSSKSTPESDKGKIEEERDTLRRKLLNTGTQSSAEKSRQQPESKLINVKDTDSIPVSQRDTRPQSEVLELTHEQMIPETETSRDARSPRDYTHAEWVTALKEPMQGIAGLEHGGSGEDTHTVGENRSEFEALRDKVQPHSGENAQEKDVLELTEEYKPQTVEAAPAERAVLTEAENEYLTAYTKFHKNKKFWNVLEPKSLKALEKTYNEARFQYADALDARLGGRMLEKYTKRNVPLMVTAEDGTLIENPLLDPARAERVRERYNRLVRFNEVIKPAAERKLDARIKALDGKDQDIVSRAFEKYTDINKSLEQKYGKQGARAIRSVMFATVFTAGATLGAAGFAAAGVGSFSAAALYAAIGIIPAKSAKSFVSGLVGGRLGVSLGDKFQASRFGNASVEKGKEHLSQHRQSGRTFSLSSVEDLEKYEKKQAKLSSVASGEKLKRNKSLIQLLTSIGLGVGTAEVISNWNSIEHLVVGGSPESGAVPNTDTPPSTKAAPLESKGGGVRPDTTPAKVELTVAKGEGANQLFQDLKAQYPDPENYPPNIKALLNHHPAEVAKLLGFGTENGGIMLHPQDSISVNDHGQLVFHDHLHEKDIIVVNESGISDEWSSKIHKLQETHAHSTAEHQPKRVHIARENVRYPRPSTSSFDANADREAVAAANRAELARVQSGDFSVITTVPAEAVSQPTVIPEAPPAIETQPPSASTIPQPEAPSTPIDTGTTPEAPISSPAPETTASAPEPTPTPETTSSPASAESGAASHSAEASAPFTTEAYERMALPYVNANGEVFVYGGPNVSVQQLEIMARSHAQANPGTLVRFTVPRHGFLGTIRPHVEGFVANPDGTFKYENIRTFPDGKPFPPIDRSKFVGISRDRQP